MIQECQDTATLLLNWDSPLPFQLQACGKDSRDWEIYSHLLDNDVIMMVLLGTGLALYGIMISF